MTYFFYLCLCLILITLQTAILPSVPYFATFYDLPTLFILYLGLYRPFRESLPVIFILGFTMDNLSGAPFGLYVTIYFWLFVGVWWITKFIRLRNVVLLPALVATAVLIENIIFLSAITFTGSWPLFYSDIISASVVQILWAVTTGPIFLMVLQRIHQLWDNWMLEWVAERDGQSE